MVEFLDDGRQAASTRPALFTPERLTRTEYFGVARVLQRGRRCSRRRGPRTSTTTSPSCSLQRGRRCSRRRGSMCLTSDGVFFQLQRGRRCSRRRGRSPRTDWDATLRLQRGRRCSRRRGASTRPARRLSLGFNEAGVVHAGEVPRRGNGVAIALASTRPALFTPERH